MKKTEQQKRAVQIKKLLEDPYWPDALEADKTYFRTHDDCDGDISKGMGVCFSHDGDAYIMTTCKSIESCRFRTSGGGGRSLRVRNALMLLAIAIDMDNKERPNKVGV